MSARLFMNIPTLAPLSDTAWIVRWENDSWETTRQITSLAQHGMSVFADERIEVVPGLTTLTFIPMGFTDEDWLRTRLEQLIHETATSAAEESRLIEVPICYDGEFGPDLHDVAQHASLSADDVIARHLGSEYLVAMLGFSPGFPYLRGLPPELAAPRRATPRLKIPAGSVGIAGTQTGIYPQATPGGWQLIGRTPTRLFALDQTPPVLLQPGDRVRFRRIDAAEYAGLQDAAKGSAR
jgi:inhibitor of KinA